jgi:hypothetical protein
MNNLTDLFIHGDYATLTILLSIFVFVWLFKDMKKSLLETKKSNLDFIDQSIESHAQSLKAIYFFLNNSISKNDLLDTLYSSYKYFDKHILDIVYKFTSSNYSITSEAEMILLINLSKELKDKISMLKDIQFHQTINKNHKFFIFDFENTVSKNNFDIYLNAIFYSLIIILVSAYTLKFIMMLYTLELQASIPLIIFTIALIFWLLLLSISIDLLIKKYYKKIYLFILFFISPFASISLIFICPNYTGKIVILILFIISIFINYYVDIKYAKSFHKK